VTARVAGWPAALLVSNGPYEMTDVAGLGWLSRGPARHRLGLGLVRLWVMTRQGRGRCRGDVALRSGREVAGRCPAAAPVQWARWAPGAPKGKGLL
jgi:hypothetical protein